MGLALVFDLDGVIVHSNPLHEMAWAEYGRRLGRRVEGPLQEKMYGRRNDEIVRALFGAELSDEEVFAHGAAKEALYREMMKPRFWEYVVPGVVSFLERHQDAPIAVASNAELPNIDFVLGNANIRKCFRVVVHGNQVKKAKPDPEVYLLAAGLLGVDPRNCIIFEDSYSGVEAGLGAGARVVGVTTTHTSLPGVDLSIDDFETSELEPWLSAQKPY